MIADPARRGRFAARFYAEVSPRLFRDIEQAGVLPSARADVLGQARREWDCFALYACVRGLVAVGGFNQETGAALDAMHDELFSPLDEGRLARHPLADDRERVSERYSEYGTIGQEGGAAGAATVTRRLGLAAARHMTAPGLPSEALADLIGELHENLAEGVAEALRLAE